MFKDWNLYIYIYIYIYEILYHFSFFCHKLISKPNAILSYIYNIKKRTSTLDQNKIKIIC